MRIVSEETNSMSVVKLSGRLDLRVSTELRRELTEALSRAGHRLVVHLGEVDFIDSSALGVLIGLHRDAERNSGSVVLVPPSGPARQIFSLSRTERYFTMSDSLEEAQEALLAK